MGANVSFLLVEEPETYEDPDFDRDSEAIDFAKESREINLNFTYDVNQNRIRSIKEKANYQKMCLHWEESVTRLQKMYHQWTASDLLHLIGQFELFDDSGDFLLDFDEFNAALDVIHDGKKKETREQLFHKADINQYNSLNVHEYLQLMHEIGVGAMPPTTPRVKPDAMDPATCARLGKVTGMDPFQQMCYNLF